MNHAQAQAILEEERPHLTVDPQNIALPDMFVVRRRLAEGVKAPPTWTPFSIHLPHDVTQDDDSPAREKETFLASLDAADKALPGGEG